jgi:hypothetical protein
MFNTQDIIKLVTLGTTLESQLNYVLKIGYYKIGLNMTHNKVSYTINILFIEIWKGVIIVKN